MSSASRERRRFLDSGRNGTFNIGVAKLTVGDIAHELSEDVITIGRAPENLIHIDDPSVSSRHAELRQSGDDWHLRDVGSTNGTQVNGVAVTETRLRAGDRVRFGRAEACYECDPNAAAQPLPEAELAEAKPADFSARPVDFTNASPFPLRRKEKDPTRTMVMAAALVAFVVFIASIVAVFTMQAPSL
jgi:pSer/pThr/pTyr-binding forkhead associated (FHA) protein